MTYYVELHRNRKGNHALDAKRKDILEFMNSKPGITSREVVEYLGFNYGTRGFEGATNFIWRWFKPVGSKDLRSGFKRGGVSGKDYVSNTNSMITGAWV